MQWGALVSWNSQGKEEKGGKFSSIFYWEYWTNWCKNYLKFLKFYLFLKFFALIINLKSKKENILLGLNLFIYFQQCTCLFKNFIQRWIQIEFDECKYNGLEMVIVHAQVQNQIQIFHKASAFINR